MKSCKERLIEWLERNTEKEKDKWNSGMKNQYFEMCDLRDLVEDFLNAKQRY